MTDMDEHENDRGKEPGDDAAGTPESPHATEQQPWHTASGDDASVQEDATSTPAPPPPGEEGPTAEIPSASSGYGEAPGYGEQPPPADPGPYGHSDFTYGAPADQGASDTENTAGGAGGPHGPGAPVGGGSPASAAPAPEAQAAANWALPDDRSPFGASSGLPSGAQPVDHRSAAGQQRNGPGWFGVLSLVVAGMALSSGLTFAGFFAYDQFGDDTSSTPATSSSAPGSDDDPDTADSADPVAAQEGSADWEGVAEKISPSTVAIAVETAEGTSQGTGVIYDGDGTIVTNNHVVADADQVQVSLSDSRSYTASIIGTDPSTDLAVIRLDSPPDDLTPADFGDSEAAVVGQGALAAGTPLGLENTVTTGIISAVHRPVTTMGEAEDASDAAFTSALQTDAPINPGNSGGPLVDASGAVIGINSSIASFPTADQEQPGSIGLGFAIPANTVELIVPQLIESGEAQHALLGVTASDGAKEVGDVTYNGAEVMEVSGGSGADEAGLRQGDLVTAVDDIPVNGSAALTGLVRSLEIDSTHSVTVVRDGDTEQIDVTFSASD